MGNRLRNLQSMLTIGNKDNNKNNNDEDNDDRDNVDDDYLQYSQQSTQEQISDYNKTVKPTLTTTKQTGKTSQRDFLPALKNPLTYVRNL